MALDRAQRGSVPREPGGGQGQPGGQGARGSRGRGCQAARGTANSNSKIEQQRQQTSATWKAAMFGEGDYILLTICSQYDYLLQLAWFYSIGYTHAAFEVEGVKFDKHFEDLKKNICILFNRHKNDVILTINISKLV